jgi:hypothetical protein
VRADEDTEAGRVPDLQRADVQQQIALAVVDAVLEELPQRRSRPAVESPHQIDLRARPDHPDVESRLLLHVRPLVLAA